MTNREAVEQMRRERRGEAERRGTLTPSALALAAARQIANDRRFYIDDEEMIESHAAIIERALQQEKTNSKT